MLAATQLCPSTVSGQNDVHSATSCQTNTPSMQASSNTSKCSLPSFDKMLATPFADVAAVPYAQQIPRKGVPHMQSLVHSCATLCPTGALFIQVQRCSYKIARPRKAWAPAALSSDWTLLRAQLCVSLEDKAPPCHVQPNAAEQIMPSVCLRVALLLRCLMLQCC